MREDNAYHQRKLKERTKAVGKIFLQGFKVKKDNKMRGAYGETDFGKRTIRINKKRHSSRTARRINKKKDGTEHLLGTIYHETLHVKHPKAHEKTIRKMEKRGIKKMSKKTKAKYYSLVR